MPRICVIAVLCTLLGAGVFSRQPTVVAITGGTLIDGNGGTPEAQRVVVAEAHGRGKVAETHSTTSDGLRSSEAGIRSPLGRVLSR